MDEGENVVRISVGLGSEGNGADEFRQSSCDSFLGLFGGWSGASKDFEEQE